MESFDVALFMDECRVNQALAPFASNEPLRYASYGSRNRQACLGGERFTGGNNRLIIAPSGQL